MFKELFTTKRICRAGIIAALYVALTWSFGQLSVQGLLQIRPGEALTVLPLFYVEAIPALVVGCLLSNIISMYGVYDIALGPIATLIAAILTYGTGKLIREQAKPALHALRVAVGGFFPVIVNAIIVPVIIVFLYGDMCGYSTMTIAYWVNFGSLVATQSLWVYALGVPLYLAIRRCRRRGISVFLDGKKKNTQPTQDQTTIS